MQKHWFRVSSEEERGTKMLLTTVRQEAPIVCLLLDYSVLKIDSSVTEVPFDLGQQYPQRNEQVDEGTEEGR